MDLLTFKLDSQEHLKVGKKKISEGMRCLRDLVQRYSKIPEKAGMVSEIMAYFQYLQQQIQEITQTREHIASIGLTQKWEIDSVMNEKGDTSSCSKRKKWSKGREDLNVRELNDSDLVRKIIRCGFNGIKDNVLEVYEHEKSKLHRYLDKVSGRFNVTIDELFCNDDVWYVVIWFINDNWKLEKRIIHLEKEDIEIRGDINENSLKRLIQDWNIDKRILSMMSGSRVMELNGWPDEGASFPFIGNYTTCCSILSELDCGFFCGVLESDILIKVGELRDYYMRPSNRYKFELAVKKVESMGKKVTIKYDDGCYHMYFKLLDWAMGYKEVFCELKHIDLDFKSINNFDWDDAALLHNMWAVLQDIQNDFCKLADSEYKWANECFPMVYNLFLKVLQFKNAENHYFRFAALRCREIFDEYCNNSKLVFVITVILDPRFKVDIVQHFYEEIYDNEADLHFQKIMDGARNIYNEYAKDVNNSSTVRAYAFPQYAKEAATSKSELDCYLTDSKVPLHEGFDILEWWRVNSPTYPTLASMARDFLSMPISGLGGVPPDNFISPFSYDINDIFKSRCLDVGLKCALACTKVWLNDPQNMS